MAHRIIERPPTPAELEVIRNEQKTGLFSFPVLYAFTVLTILVFFFGSIGGFIVKHLLSGSPDIFNYVAWAFGAALLSIIALGLYNRGRDRHALARMDAEEGVVQEIWVKDPRALQVGFEDIDDPAVIMDIGDGKLLYCSGQWMHDPRIYGTDAESMTQDPVETRVNGMPDPYGFPATEFTLVRLRHGGTPLSLKITGGYLEPEVNSKLFDSVMSLNDTEIFVGRLEDAEQILYSENARDKLNPACNCAAGS